MTTPRVRADTALCHKLAQLDVSKTLTGTAQDISQERADEILTRTVWSRLVEPGDHVAGELIARLGAAPVLQLLIEGASAKRICTLAEQETLAPLSPKSISAALKRWLPRLDRNASIADIERGVSSGLSILTPDEDAWPATVNDLGTHAPLVLWFRGDPQVLRTQSLAVVGARASTGYGSHVTAEIVDGVCGAGVSIVSGAAYGIDAVAHRTALAGEAPTIAVLAGGADRAYPAAHRQLIDRIANSGGVVCSEMLPGAAPTRWRFLQRNRVIAALSSAVLVTEAGARSGSLNTAGHAAELGRALGAVPGPVTSAASTGCHRLIREYGAIVVTNTAETLELIGVGNETLFVDFDPVQHTNTAALTDGAPRSAASHQRLLDALPLRGGRSLGDTAKRAGLGFDESRGIMAELELLGMVKRYETPGGGEHKWTLVRRE
ncbi:MAG: DNA-processing protein DprA [Leucobacter sp.]